jgi:hypothetical protein
MAISGLFEEMAAIPQNEIDVYKIRFNMQIT